MADKKRMKGITYCGECVHYNHRKHRCELGANQESNPKDPFYDDCPIPDVEQLDEKEIRNKAIDEFLHNAEVKITDMILSHQGQIDFASGLAVANRMLDEVAEQMKEGAE